MLAEGQREVPVWALWPAQPCMRAAGYRPRTAAWAQLSASLPAPLAATFLPHIPLLYLNKSCYETKQDPGKQPIHSEKWDLNSISVLISKEEAVIVCNTHPLSSELISLITEKLKANNFLCTITSLGGQLPWKSLLPFLLLRVYLHGKGREI